MSGTCRGPKRHGLSVKLSVKNFDLKPKSLYKDTFGMSNFVVANYHSVKKRSY
jgi:hypothetical protein